MLVLIMCVFLKELDHVVASWTSADPLDCGREEKEIIIEVHVAWLLFHGCSLKPIVPFSGVTQPHQNQPIWHQERRVM